MTIQVEHLSKRYGDGYAVNDVTFTVEPVQVTGFLGPAGAGKSTTMCSSVGLDRLPHPRCPGCGLPRRGSRRVETLRRLSLDL